MPNRNVSTEVWNDPKFTDDFTAEDKYFWLFILTTRYGNMSGCFEITPNQIAKDMGYSKETALNLIYRFVNIHKMIAYDNDTNEILIFKWYKYNWTKSPKMEKNIYQFINEVKSDDLRNVLIEMYENYKNGDRVSIGYQYLTNTNTIPITIPNPNSITNSKDKDTNIKHKYGTNKNVLLTEEEHQKLIDEGLEEYIENLSFYIASKKVSYKSHYMTILSWKRRDDKKKREEDKPKFKTPKGVTTI